MAGAAMAMSSVSVVSNSLRLRGFTPPRSAETILHPPLRSRLADVGYLLAVGLLALLVGGASLYFLRPAMADGHGESPMPALAFAVDATLDTNGPVVPGQPINLLLTLRDIASGGQASSLATEHE